MLILRKFFKLPSPVDLGMSKHNALPSRDFTPSCKGPTWEDYYAEVKKLHPIKYFLVETLPDFWRYKIWYKCTRPFTDAYYWIVSHFIPSRKYHMLDLRQPKMRNGIENQDAYRYGWHDVPEKMVYAMMNLLDSYLIDECPEKYHDPSVSYSLEEIEADEGLKHQYHNLTEARAISHWWNNERNKETTKRIELLQKWSAAHRACSPEADKLSEELWAHEKFCDDKLEEMLIRLIKIRPSLWT